MNVVTFRPRATTETLPVADDTLVLVEIFNSLAAAEPHWRVLEDAFATPYQRYDFLRLWHLHVGSPAGVKPLIVVGFNAAKKPLFLFPFGCYALGPWRVVEFLGGKHVNFNMALWRCRVAGSVKAADLRAALACLIGRADILWLRNQPLTWDGAANPFTLLPKQPAASSGFSGALTSDFEALLREHTNSSIRRKMLKKQRALAELGELKFAHMDSPQRIREVLDTFFRQKSERMRALGITDVFAKPGVQRFIESAASVRLPGGAPLIELYALTVDDKIVATLGGVVNGSRFSGMFNSIASGCYAVHSPGEQLIIRLARHCCERNLVRFDLGIGEGRYKQLFCGDAEPLFNTFLPLTLKGWLLAHILQFGVAGKRIIKQHKSFWSLALSLRALRARLNRRKSSTRNT